MDRKAKARLEGDLAAARARVEYLDAELKTIRERNDDLQHEALRHKLALEGKEREHRQAIAHERTLRLSAQRGLIERLRAPCVSCGKPWHDSKIAYDPDQDVEIQAFENPQRRAAWLSGQPLIRQSWLRRVRRRLAFLT